MKKNENHNSITKNVIKASVKGAIGNVPILGSFFNEYFSLIEENINQNKLQEWFDEIENKMNQLEIDVSSLSNNSFFYFSLNKTTKIFMETEIKEKKQLLSNALCNCSKTIHLNTNQIFGIIDEDKKRIFLIFLEKYTVSQIFLLLYCLTYKRRDAFLLFTENSKCYTKKGEHLNSIETDIFCFIPEIDCDIGLLNFYTLQLYNDGFITKKIDWSNINDLRSSEQLITDIVIEFLYFLNLCNEKEICESFY